MNFRQRLVQDNMSFLELAQAMNSHGVKTLETWKLFNRIPKIVCLCGSTRFYKEFVWANYYETMKGHIVLSVGFFTNSSEEAHGGHVDISPDDKKKLDELHKRKIDLADEVFVINVRGYIGESTRSEIDYAIAAGKPIRYLDESIYP